MLEAATPLVGKLLIAMPTLADPNFWHTVVLVGVHSTDEGAFGLVINRPLEVELADILDELGEKVPRRCWRAGPWNRITGS
jgi:putative transcriptional regulator